MKTILTFLLIAFISALNAAEIPLKWTIDVNRATTPSFDLYRGETSSLEATLIYRGAPFYIEGNAYLFWQTNGMGSTYWKTDACISNNVLYGVWSPSNDVGSASYNCFLGIPGSNYRAAFRLRMLTSPGMTPNELPLPTKSIDFAQVEVRNAPWATTNALQAVIDDVDHIDRAIRESIEPDIWNLRYDVEEVKQNVDNKTSKTYVDAKVADAQETAAAAAAGVAMIGSALNAENARFVSTNYNSQARIPEAWVEVKVSNNWLTVWKEMTRWDWLTDTYLPGLYATQTELEKKADRAWGFYDSHTGQYSPDGFTQISSPNILLGAGMSYQKHVTTSSAVWILQSSGVSSIGDGDDDGGFRIKDSEGNVQFEIVKGNKREIGADPDGVAVTNADLYAHYTVEGAQPMIYCGANLGEKGTWKREDEEGCEAHVTWTGTSGNWTAKISPKNPGGVFFANAGVTVGGEDLIKQNIPVKMSHIYIGDQKYAIGTATISGHTVMTLTPSVGN